MPGAGGDDLLGATGQSFATSTQLRQRQLPEPSVARARGGRCGRAFGAGDRKVDVRPDPDVLEPPAQAAGVQRGRHHCSHGLNSPRPCHAHGVCQKRQERRGSRDNTGARLDRRRASLGGNHIHHSATWQRRRTHQHGAITHDRAISRSAFQPPTQRRCGRLALGHRQRHQLGRVAGPDAGLNLQGGDRPCNGKQPRRVLLAELVRDDKRKDKGRAEQQWQQYDAEDECQTDSHRQRVHPPDVCLDGDTRAARTCDSPPNER